MKKCFLILLAGSLALTCGCGKDVVGTKTISVSAQGENVGGLVYCSGEMSVTEYGVVFPVESNAGGVLTYYDYTSETKYPFCGNANCEHKDDSCDAWFDSAVSGATIYAGHVYLFSYDSEKGDWTFLTMDADGTNRKKIETFSASDFSCDAVGLNSVWYENDAVVFVVQCESWDEASRYCALGKINLSDGKFSVLATLNAADTSVLGYENGVFFFECGVWDESPLTEEEFYAENDTGDYETYYSEAYASHFNQKYFLLDTNSGTTEDMGTTDEMIDARSGNITGILTLSGEETSAEWDYDGLADDGIFYGTAGNTIYGVDFANKTLNVVYQSENQLSIQCAADGNIFFLQLNDAREEMLANSYLNIETSEVTDLNGRISGGGWIFGSSENFFVGNGKNGSICISKEDYYASAFKNVVVMEKE